MGTSQDCQGNAKGTIGGLLLLNSHLNEARSRILMSTMKLEITEACKGRRVHQIRHVHVGAERVVVEFRYGGVEL